MPVEATENVAPVIFWAKELRPDSGGAGRTRGGTGQTMEVGAKGDLEFAVNATFDRVANAPRGREGGLNGAAGVVALKSGTKLRTKGFQVIPDGDRLILKLPGGAGMGDPTARDPRWWRAMCATGWYQWRTPARFTKLLSRPTAHSTSPPQLPLRGAERRSNLGHVEGKSSILAYQPCAAPSGNTSGTAAWGDSNQNVKLSSI